MNDLPAKKDAKKKKPVMFAGGFQGNFVAPGGQKACVKGDLMVPEKRITNQSALNQLRRAMVSSSSQERLLQNNTPTNPQSFLESLSEQERVELSKRLVAPANAGTKLKHMIDDLYQREKKYVKQYLREDYIEKNNVIFELDKSHALDTTKGMRTQLAPAVPQSVGELVGGLYSIGSSQPGGGLGQKNFELAPNMANKQT